MYDWNEVKRAENISKHEVDFALVEGFEWGSALIARDVRRDYGELRYSAFGLIEDRLFNLVFTPRSGKVRVISLRRANCREVRHYVNQTEDKDASGG
ncbi:MAG: BrnT family toxin [Betaproteobacteria bacterium]|nr:BrnT family toxin [Betaproteobacteria bacterium]